MPDTINNLAFERGAPLKFPPNEAIPLDINQFVTIGDKNCPIIPKAGYSKIFFNGGPLFSTAIVQGGNESAGIYHSTLPISTFLINTPRHKPLFCVLINKLYLQSLSNTQELSLYLGIPAEFLKNRGRWFLLDDNFKIIAGDYPFDLYPLFYEDNILKHLVFEEFHYSLHTAPLVQEQMQGHFFFLFPHYLL